MVLLKDQQQRFDAVYKIFSTTDFSQKATCCICGNQNNPKQIISNENGKIFNNKDISLNEVCNGLILCDKCYVELQLLKEQEIFKAETIRRTNLTLAQWGYTTTNLR